MKSYTHSSDAEEILVLEDKIKAITAKDVQEVAKKYLDRQKGKIILTLMPQKK